MPYVDFITRFMFALVASSLVGIERERSKLVSDKDSPPIFGIRSIVMIGVLGFLFTYTSVTIENPVLLYLGIITVLVISTATYLSSIYTKKQTGSTTYLASIAVFFVGLFSGFGGYTNYIIAAAISIITTILLATGREFSEWTQRINKEEILAAAKIGVLSLIILPLIPNEYMGPYNLFNPFKVWYIIVAVSLIYLISYIFMKLFSQKGLILSSFFSGIMYSSPTVYQISNLVKNKKISVSYAKSCVFLATFAALLSHLLIIIFVFRNVELLKLVMLPYAVGMSVLIVLTYIFAREEGNTTREIEATSPFSLWPVLKFGALFSLLVLLGGAANVYFGENGLLPTTISGSLVSATTVVSSIADLIEVGNLSLMSGAFWIIISAIVSLLVKVVWIGGPKSKELFKITSIGVLLTSFFMALTFFFQNRFF